MRVLHLASTFPRFDGDSVGPYLGDLVGAEAALGLDVRVLAPHGPGVAPVVAGVPVERFRYGPASMEGLAYGAGLLAAARTPRGAVMLPPYLASFARAGRRAARDVDLVHAHWWFPAGAVAAVSGRPYVVTLHGSDVMVAARLRPLARSVLRRASAVVAVSAALAETASSVVGVEVGVAPMPAARVAAGPGPRRGLVAVGRLAPEKGFDVLVAAMAHVDPNVPLDIIGDGPERGALQAKAGPNVRFLGALPRSAYLERLGAASALVVPSRREGLGLVAVEAVLAGTPVIASAVGGLPGVVASDGGMLVAPEDPLALAEAIGRVGQLRPPGPCARAAAAAHEPTVVAERHLALYREAAGSLRGR